MGFNEEIEVAFGLETKERMDLVRVVEDKGDFFRRKKNDETIADDLGLRRLRQIYFDSIDPQYSSFCQKAASELIHPPTNPELIRKRQKIAQTLLEDKEKLLRIIKLSGTAKSLAADFKDKEKEAREFGGSLQDPFSKIGALKGFRTAFKSIEDDLPNSPPFDIIKREARQVMNLSGFEMTFLDLDQILDNPFTGTIDLQRGTLTYQLKDGAKKSAHLHDVVDDILRPYADKLYNQAKGFSKFFSAMLSVLPFYASLTRLAHGMQENGIPFCFPTIVDRKGYLRASHFLNPLLASTLLVDEKKRRDDLSSISFEEERLYGKELLFSEEVQAHDYSSEGADIHAVAGRNHASKTTYVIGRGVLQLMGQIGGPVPAESCEMGVVDSIETVCVTDVEIGAGQSTFSRNLDRVGNLFDHAKPGSLVLLDDFTEGTEPDNARDFLKWTFEQFLRIGCQVYLATQHKEFPGDGRIRVYTTVPGEYKIVPAAGEIEKVNWRVTAKDTALQNHL